MTKRTSGAEREAARRRRAVPPAPAVVPEVVEPPGPDGLACCSAPQGWLDGLEAVAAQLHALERDRALLLDRRDELVAGLRAGGASWDVLAAAAGTSRQALMKRPER